MRFGKAKENFLKLFNCFGGDNLNDGDFNNYLNHEFRKKSQRFLSIG